MMNKSPAFLVAIALTVVLSAPAGSEAGNKEVRKVQSSIEVMTEIMGIPEGSIPPSLLQSAEGLAIFPGLIKAGFIVGGRYGTGVLVVRTEDRRWSNPVFVSLAGGSFGWQIGAQATDIILVFRTARSTETITSGKFTLGADASIAAGPVGRHAEAGTDVQLKSEILSYSRSRGLFAGISLEGAVMQIDYKATSGFYNMAGLVPMQIFRSRDLKAPAVAEDLKRALGNYTR